MRVNNGYIEYVDANGNWQQLISLDELKGADGKNGVDGKDGKDGTSATVYATAAADGKTVYVTGPKGDTGAAGAAGAAGATGPKGDKGNPGKDGDTVSVSKYGELLINGSRSGWRLSKMPEETTWPDWTGKPTKEFYDWCKQYGVAVGNVEFVVRNGMKEDLVGAVDAQVGTSTYDKDEVKLSITSSTGYLNVNYVDESGNLVDQKSAWADGPDCKLHKDYLTLKGYQILDTIPDVLPDGPQQQTMDVKVKETGMDFNIWLIDDYGYHYENTTQHLYKGTYKMSKLASYFGDISKYQLVDPNEDVKVDYSNDFIYVVVKQNISPTQEPTPTAEPIPPTPEMIPEPAPTPIPFPEETPATDSQTG